MEEVGVSVSDTLERQWRRLTETVGDFVQGCVKPIVYEHIAPKVRAYDQTAREDAISQLRVLCATLDRETRDAESRLTGLLDSRDVRWALSELRSRTEELASNLQLGRVKFSRLLGFLSAATELGVEDIRAASDDAQVADAIGRVIDDVHTYLLDNAFVAPQLARPRSLAFSDIRRGENRVFLATDLSVWRLSPGRLRKSLRRNPARTEHEHALVA